MFLSDNAGVEQIRIAQFLCRVRISDSGPVLPHGCGQTMARELLEMLRMQNRSGFRAHLLCTRRKYLL